MLTVAGNPETKEDPGPQLTAQQESGTWRNPDKRLENRERCLCRSRYVDGRHTNTCSHGGVLVFPCTCPPDGNCATHASPGQPHFASSEYLWMLFGVHIPLWGRLPGMGRPILSPRSCLSRDPCTSSNCSLYSTMPGRHRRSWCYGEKLRGPKTAQGLSEARSQVRKDRINAGGGRRWMAFLKVTSQN